ncbi:MAG TPA: S8 family serine peptidase [Candidatus Limnocylindria bacterium]|nr:S8 family serine peptidase [Candidatus Limnocylindria bacterium]
MLIGRKQTAIVVALCLASLVAGRAADLLNWDAARDRVDATIETWTIPELLQRVATSTGWEIYLDPGITNRIPARFSAKEPGEALRKLLGNYSYALIPDTNSRSKRSCNSRDQATRAIQPLVAAASKGSTNRIGNELIVTLKPGEKIEDLAKKLDAKIVGRSDDQNTYRLRFEDEKAADTARASLEGDSSVESVDDNYYVARPESAQALGTPGKPLGLNPTVPADGKYTIVGLVDTAVDAKGGNFADFILPGTEASGASSDGTPSHGTAMAEIILRSLAMSSDDKSTTVRLLPFNVFGEGGETTTTFDIAKGIYVVVNGGAKWVNLSLGGNGESTYLYNTMKSSYDQGVRFYVAAGNEPVTTPTIPANYPFVTSVTAGNRDGTLASYANRAPSVDVIAPGSAVVNYGNLQWRFDGTSTSTAIVTGQAAAAADKTKKSGATN